MGRLESSWLGEIWRRVRFLVGGARFEDDLAEEMRLHVELRAEEKRVAGGWKKFLTQGAGLGIV